MGVGGNHSLGLHAHLSFPLQGNHADRFLGVSPEVHVPCGLEVAASPSQTPPPSITTTTTGACQKCGTSTPPQADSEPECSLAAQVTGWRGAAWLSNPLAGKCASHHPPPSGGKKVPFPVLGIRRVNHMPP